MTIVLLHLSDIHIKTARDPILARTREIAACAFSVLHPASHVFIIVSGDIAYSGSAEQYGLATEFFAQIRDILSSEAKCEISFVLVPGNHDCNFERNTGARKLLVTSLEGANALEIDDSIVATCTEIQSEFFDFRHALEARSNVDDDRLWRISRFEVNGKTITFDCLNIPWVSKIHEDPGRLYFPIDKYSTRVQLEPDLRIVVMHHPLNWFNQSIYRSFRTFIRTIADIVISGHEHQGAVGTITDADSDMSAYIEGCVLQGEQNLTDSAFNVITVDIDHGQFASTQFRWDGTRYKPTEEGSWSDYHDLPAKRINPFAISSAFQEQMDDPGAYFKHPGRTNITLSDIFVYPDLRKIGNGSGEDRRRVFVNSSQLRAPEATADGILLEGEEKAGGTSLLYQLYREYHGRGYVPLYVKGKDLRRSTDAEIDAAVRHAVQHQYGASQVIAFDQLSSSKKLLLLDDFDDGPMKAANARADLLSSLRRRFGHIVVTVGNMFEVREMLEGDKSRALVSLEHYVMQPFGHVLRAQLVSRWVSLCTDGTVSAATLLARRDQAEKLMNAVMTKAVIPSVPLYLLTLLQSMEAGRGGDFKDSGLGYYYQFLLTEAFQSSGVKADKLTEVFQYAGQLAWEFHAKNRRDLSIAELKDFNNRFSKEWHTVEFQPRLDVLVEARVLAKVGEDYAFRYPYIYYFLKGQVLSEKLGDIDVRAYIAHCCGHLYVRDHANTVLFLAHHTNDNYVLDCIADGMRSLFRTCQPLTFKGDTDGVARFISAAPQLKYSGETPQKHRERRNELADKLDDGHDGLAECEEESENLSLLAQMTMLFKTTEILGQVLKNQYSKIPRTRKGKLIEELFDGPLRALHDFFDFCEKNPDALDAVVEAALRKKNKVLGDEERKTIARKAVGSVVQVITFAFVWRTVQSANSESLVEDVRDVVKRRASPAFKLIEMGMVLDSPKALPRPQLKQLHKEIQSDFLANRLLQMMLLNRLYMFKTSEQDMQWLHEEMQLDLGMQHAITYRENRLRVSK